MTKKNCVFVLFKPALLFLCWPKDHQVSFEISNLIQGHSSSCCLFETRSKSSQSWLAGELSSETVRASGKPHTVDRHYPLQRSCELEFNLGRSQVITQISKWGGGLPRGPCFCRRFGAEKLERNAAIFLREASSVLKWKGADAEIEVSLIKQWREVGACGSSLQAGWFGSWCSQTRAGWMDTAERLWSESDTVMIAEMLWRMTTESLIEFFFFRIKLYVRYWRGMLKTSLVEGYVKKRQKENRCQEIVTCSLLLSTTSCCLVGVLWTWQE